MDDKGMINEIDVLANEIMEKQKAIIEKILEKRGLILMDIEETKARTAQNLAIQQESIEKELSKVQAIAKDNQIRKDNLDTQESEIKRMMAESEGRISQITNLNRDLDEKKKEIVDSRASLKLEWEKFQKEVGRIQSLITKPD